MGHSPADCALFVLVSVGLATLGHYLHELRAVLFLERDSAGRAGVSRLLLVPLHGGLHEYRMRCDLCQWSGPWSCFVQSVRDDPRDGIDVCEQCMGDELTVRGLITCGWRFR